MAWLEQIKRRARPVSLTPRYKELKQEWDRQRGQLEIALAIGGGYEIAGTALVRINNDLERYEDRFVRKIDRRQFRHLYSGTAAEDRMKRLDRGENVENLSPEDPRELKKCYRMICAIEILADARDERLAQIEQLEQMYQPA